MGAYYDEIEIEDMSWDDKKCVYHCPCQCGDCFEISRKRLANYEDVAICSSCSLIIRVIYDPVSMSCKHVVKHTYSFILQLDLEDEPPEEDVLDKLNSAMIAASA